VALSAGAVIKLKLTGSAHDTALTALLTKKFRRFIFSLGLGI
jgi:hypothetical protein